MKIISVNVGGVRTVEWDGQQVATGIFKAPVEGRARVGKLNLEGDWQADLRIHGGPDKAVYVYPGEHYPFWQSEFGVEKYPWGMFGENLTTEGLTEDAVTQPRQPCFKMQRKIERDDLIKRFLRSGRTGFYLWVLKEGDVGAGDRLERMGGEKIPSLSSISIACTPRRFKASSCWTAPFAPRRSRRAGKGASGNREKPSPAERSLPFFRRNR